MARPADHMKLNALNLWRILGGDAQPMSLFFLRPVVGAPEVHDFIPDEDVSRPCPYPLLPFGFCKKLLLVQLS